MFQFHASTVPLIIPFLFSYSLDTHGGLFSPVLVQHQNLHHADENVQKVQLQRDTLVDGIPLDNTSLSQTGVVKHLLYIIQGEAAKDGKTTVQPDVLSESQCPDSGSRDDKRGQTRGGDDGSTGQKRSANVEIFLLLSRSADNRQGTHHGNSVETGAGEKRHGNKRQHGSDKGSLSGVKGSPEGIFGDVAIIHTR